MHISTLTHTDTQNFHCVKKGHDLRRDLPLSGASSLARISYPCLGSYFQTLSTNICTLNGARVAWLSGLHLSPVGSPYTHWLLYSGLIWAAVSPEDKARGSICDQACCECWDQCFWCASLTRLPLGTLLSVSSSRAMLALSATGGRAEASLPGSLPL